MKNTHFDEWQTKRICKDPFCDLATIKQKIERACLCKHAPPFE